MGKAKKKPTIVGYHNDRLYGGSQTVILKGNSYKKRSTVCFIPTLGSLSVRWFQAWNMLMKPMNQKFTQICVVNQEVGKAYEQMVELIRGNPELRTWDYVLTFEHDNLPPPDGLLKLYEDIESSGLDAVGALYFTKCEGGQPMCYGKVKDEYGIPIGQRNFIPWIPPANSVSECQGLGMGFTLFRMKMLLDEELPKPVFLTEQSYTPGVGIRSYTQDLRFFENAGKLGYKFGASTNVLVGHYDQAEDRIW